MRQDDTFLKKLYPSDEFLLTTTDYASVDFGLLPDQHLLILNELEALSESLRVAIQSFARFWRKPFGYSQ